MGATPTVPMLAPDGTSGDVPQANVQAALAKGFKQAVAMTSPDGKQGYIPLGRAQDALAAGFNIDMSRVAGSGPGGPPQLAAHPQSPAMQSSLLAPSTYGKAISDTIAGLATPLAHIPSQIASYNLPQAIKNAGDSGPIQSIEDNPDKGAGIANAIMQVGTGLALGKAMEGVGSSAKYVAGKISPEVVAGQNYTVPHAQAFEGAIAPATAMGKNFIPQNVTPEALTPIRATAARLAQGTPIEQGIVKAATSSSTPPLERIGAYQNIVQSTLDDLEAQHVPALAQASNVPVDTAPIVQRLKGLISPTMAPADVSAVNELASRVQGAQTIGALNKFRQELNTETSPEYKQSQVQAGRSGISAQATSDLAGWIRNAYYDNLQQATGTDFAPLKRQEANLITTQEALQNQQAPLAKAEATYNAPSTLRETAGNVANVVKDPKTTITQTILRESPATKVATLLQKSLQNLPAYQTPSAPPIRAQLPAPAPAVVQPPAALPAQSGGAYPMPGTVPYSPGMSVGERSAALNQWLRQRQQLALPEKAAPIPLPPPR